VGFVAGLGDQTIHVLRRQTECGGACPPVPDQLLERIPPYGLICEFIDGLVFRPERACPPVPIQTDRGDRIDIFYWSILQGFRQLTVGQRVEFLRLPSVGERHMAALVTPAADND
jgi:hypothetical protein